jgi:hypothetical protein
LPEADLGARLTDSGFDPTFARQIIFVMHRIAAAMFLPKLGVLQAEPTER